MATREYRLRAKEAEKSAQAKAEKQQKIYQLAHRILDSTGHTT